MAKYAVLKKERDEAIERAVEAERLSMKSEVDRLIADHAAEMEKLREDRAIEVFGLKREIERLNQRINEAMRVLDRRPIDP